MSDVVIDPKRKSKSDTRTVTEVFEDHLAKRLAGETGADIAENYANSVVILTGTGALLGHEGARQSAAELSRLVGDAVFTYRHTLVQDRYAFLEWTAKGDGVEVPDGADSFVIADGKIVFQSIHYTVKRR